MRLPSPYRLEADVVQHRLHALEGHLNWDAARQAARPWVQAVRHHPPPFWALESLLKEFPIDSQEGLALMRLAEALLRVPDVDTAIVFTADQLGQARFDGREHSTLGRLSSSAIALSRQFLPEASGQAAPPGLMSRLGAQAVVSAAIRAVQLLGRQFVLGEDIEQALAQAQQHRAAQARLRHSFDMLGEGARTEADALRHLSAYQRAIEHIGQAAQSQGEDCRSRDGISIKLSALYPRYEAVQHPRVMRTLLPRVIRLCDQAAQAGINLTVDAEEVERLELSLDLFDALLKHVAQHHPRWEGLGLALQAYQTRALELVEHVVWLARRHGVRLMCRLVKGAYWDAEIKRTQELGLRHYPVFTHKHHTDISYLACARSLLAAHDVIFPQFATHNAGTIAALCQMANAMGAPFELQRLHGMGEGVYREVMAHTGVPCRVYAPVGEHRDLLAYLVRRLLENGANSSFVHQLADPGLGLDELLQSPLHLSPTTGVPLPADLYGPVRVNSQGLDLSVQPHREMLEQAWAQVSVPPVNETPLEQLPALMAQAQLAGASWRDVPTEARALVLRRCAQQLQAELPRFAALLVKEARKTWADAVGEVRETIDFLRYDAQEAERVMAPVTLPSPYPGLTGEHNTWRLRPRGVWVCISPWNFPLAIFTGQVVAALVTGNTVLAKPAEQTPGVAQAMVALLHHSGVPRDALQLVHGPGETVGAALVELPGVAGVAFTGSTATARHINMSLAQRPGPLVPLIAETGGINAMVVDSTALPEQVVDAVVQSAFRSAGQRCSALRLLCLHHDVAERVIDMLRGAVAELKLGPAQAFDTDIGPVIDASAMDNLQAHVRRSIRQHTPLWSVPDEALHAGSTQLFPPVAFEVSDPSDLQEEIFGPVLHVLRWQGDPSVLLDRINAMGHGLTLGLQTRIDTRARQLAHHAQVGNVYVNRNMIGAVVGLQPFGGQGLSGTGPKAGGPLYLPRFCTEQTLTVNTAAAGGNVALLSQIMPRQGEHGA